MSGIYSDMTAPSDTVDGDTCNPVDIKLLAVANCLEPVTLAMACPTLANSGIIGNEAPGVTPV